jgi:hypothetical protein
MNFREGSQELKGLACWMEISPFDLHHRRFWEALIGLIGPSKDRSVAQTVRWRDFIF